MSPRKSSWLKFVTPVAAAALVLTACGSDNDDDSADAGDNGAVEETDDPDDAEDEDEDVAEDTDDFDEEDDSDDSAGGGSEAYEEVADLDPVTGEVAVGEWAGPLYVDTDEEAQIWLRVDEVNVGDEADLDVFEDEDFSGQKPVYLSVTAVNAGDVEVDEASVRVDVTDSNGNSENSFTYMGELPGDCAEQGVETGNYLDLQPTEEGESCRSGLISADADPETISYVPYYGAEEQTWTVN